MHEVRLGHPSAPDRPPAPAAAPPTLAVVVAARNAQATLDRALRSLQAGTSPPDELIVVDDCSTDATAEVAARWGATVIRLRSRSGPGGARNAGVDACRSEVVAFVDADDEVDVAWAKAIRDAFAAGADLCAATLVPGPRISLASWVDGFWARRSGIWTGGGFLPAVTGAALAVRRSTFLDIGGFDGYFLAGEDTDLTARLALRGVMPIPVDDAIVLWHQRTRVWGRCRQQLRNLSWYQRRYWKYYRFPFASGRKLRGPQLVVSQLIRSTGWLLTGRPGGPPMKAEALLRPLVTVAGMMGWVSGWMALRFGPRKSPPPIAPSSTATEGVTESIRAEPAAVVVCPSAVAAAWVRFWLNRETWLVVARARTMAWAVRSWDEPAPWAVRTARATALGNEYDLARRIEREDPGSLGASVSAAFGCHASRLSMRGWIVVTDQKKARALATRWPQVPRVPVAPVQDARAGFARCSEDDLEALQDALSFRLSPSVRRLLGGRGEGAGLVGAA